LITGALLHAVPLPVHDSMWSMCWCNRGPCGPRGANRALFAQWLMCPWGRL